MLAIRTLSSDSRPAKASQFFTVDPLVNVIQVGLLFIARIRDSASVGITFV